MTSEKRQVYEFDNFRLDPGERQLLRDGQPITLPSKAFDLLLVLVENSGRLVEKEELYRRVWADQVVEESNLTVQMSAIRKALGESRQRQQYISTVTGRGYRFVAGVTGSIEDHEVRSDHRAPIIRGKRRQLPLKFHGTGRDPLL